MFFRLVSNRSFCHGCGDSELCGLVPGEVACCIVEIIVLLYGMVRRVEETMVWQHEP